MAEQKKQVDAGGLVPLDPVTGQPKVVEKKEEGNAAPTA